MKPSYPACSGAAVISGTRRNLVRMPLYPHTSRSLGPWDSDVGANLELCGHQSPTNWPCDPVSYRMAGHGEGGERPWVFYAVRPMSPGGIYDVIQEIGVTLVYTQRRTEGTGGIRLSITQPLREGGTFGTRVRRGPRA